MFAEWRRPAVNVLDFSQEEIECFVLNAGRAMRTTRRYACNAAETCKRVHACDSVAGTGVVLPPGTTVPNYLVFAILATVFCCLPTGIPAIVYAAQVNGKLQAG